MLDITDTAGTELKKVLNSEQAKEKNLIITFQGVGWSGPSLGLALDESTEGLEKLESNGVGAYIDPKLKVYLGNFGQIRIDFVNQDFGPSGFIIRVGNASCDPNSDACSSCG